MIVNWTLRNKLMWNFNQNTKLFIHENASEKIICEMAAILRWVDMIWVSFITISPCTTYWLQKCMWYWILFSWSAVDWDIANIWIINLLVDGNLYTKLQIFTNTALLSWSNWSTCWSAVFVKIYSFMICSLSNSSVSYCNGICLMGLRKWDTCKDRMKITLCTP